MPMATSRIGEPNIRDQPPLKDSRAAEVQMLADQFVEKQDVILDDVFLLAQSRRSASIAKFRN